MIHATQSQPPKRAHDIGDNVVKVKVATIRQEPLEELGADPQTDCADDQCKVECAPAVGVEDPIEDDGKEEEGYEVEDFVID